MLSVNKYREVNLQEIEPAINDNTFLLTILHANNEIGTIYPIKAIGLLCKKLVTIITDVPIEFNADAMKITFKKEKKIRELFEELEFRNLLQRVLSTNILSDTKTETITKVKNQFGDSASINTKQIDLFSSAEVITKEFPKNSNQIIIS